MTQTLTRRVLPLALALTLGLATAAPARAGEAATVVVELFTSQGCSSCPPADAELRRLAERPDVIALALHVDYWDYLGWRDTFARRQHTRRQYAYRDAFGARVVYTPQMVVQGRFTVEGARPDRLARMIAGAGAEPARARIEIRPDRGMLQARLSPLAGILPCEVWVALYSRLQEVEIMRGENRGRRLAYANVVQSLSRIGLWSGEAPQEIELPQPEAGQGVALWLQQPGAGPILAAAKHEP